MQPRSLQNGIDRIPRLQAGMQVAVEKFPQTLLELRVQLVTNTRLPPPIMGRHGSRRTAPRWSCSPFPKNTAGSRISQPLPGCWGSKLTSEHRCGIYCRPANRSTLAGRLGQPSFSRPANLKNPRLPDRRLGRDFTRWSANVSRTKKSHFCPSAKTVGRFYPATH